MFRNVLGSFYDYNKKAIQIKEQILSTKSLKPKMAEATGFEPASLTTNRFQGGFLTTRTASIIHDTAKKKNGKPCVLHLT